MVSTVYQLGAALGNTTPANIACGSYSTFVVGQTGNVAAWGLNNSCQSSIPKEDENDMRRVLDSGGGRVTWMR